MSALASPYIRLVIVCSKGTYIRSLARDLGGKLGCGAFLKDLVRSAYGPFTVGEAVTPETLQNSVTADQLASLLYPVDYPLSSWKHCITTIEEARHIAGGIDISLPGLIPDDSIYCRAYHPDGRFLAVMKFTPDSGLWHPQKVFNL